VGNVVIYYAGNQTAKQIEIYKTELPKVKAMLYEWFPTPPHRQPMYIIAASGWGGGWAVNAYKPRENGIISAGPYGIVSIFGHEMAHTMPGPLGASGVHAGYSPHLNQGEAHAGWFQGKVDAWFAPQRYLGKPNNRANAILDKEDEMGRMFDLKEEYEVHAAALEWKGKWGRRKMIYIWQKLDDRYGTTWYPRWYWVRSTRWAEEEAANGPAKLQLTWEQMVEDMSIAVGEDLFPFFIELGTSLDRKTIGPVEFMGKTLQLRPAPIRRTPAGPIQVDPAGDYTQPLTLNDRHSFRSVR